MAAIPGPNGPTPARKAQIQAMANSVSKTVRMPMPTSAQNAQAMANSTSRVVRMPNIPIHDSGFGQSNHPVVPD